MSEEKEKAIKLIDQLFEAATPDESEKLLIILETMYITKSIQRK